MIDTFPQLDQLIFRGPAVFSETGQPALIHTISRHPTLSVAQFRYQRGDITTLAKSAQDLRRVRATVSYSPDVIESLLQAGLQISALGVIGLSSLRAWLQYTGEAKVYHIHFLEIDGGGQEIENLVVKYRETLETVIIFGDESIRSTPWIHKWVKGLQVIDESMMILKLTCRKSFDGTFSRVSALTLKSHQTRKHLIPSDGYLRLCESLRALFPDLETMTLKFLDDQASVRSEDPDVDVTPEARAFSPFLMRY